MAKPPPILRTRRDFLACARARRSAAPGLILQARRRGEAEPADGIRVGYTCSKKVGNAVARNRAKRRLRALAADILTADGHPGWDYVLIGRAKVSAERPYCDMLRDLRGALAQVHAPRRPRT